MSSLTYDFEPLPEDPLAGQCPYLKSISITPLFPVLDRDDNAYFGLTLDIYRKGNADRIPCAIDMTSDEARKLQFHFDFQNLDVHSVTIDATLKGDALATPLIDSSSISYDKNSQIASLYLRDRRIPNGDVPLALPWGVKGDQVKHRLEICAASPFVDPSSVVSQEIHRKGLPSAALELYTIVSRNLLFQETGLHVETVETYIRAVVTAVHMGTGHIYDVWHGNCFYTDDGSSTRFNVNLWARRLHFAEVPQDFAYMVNCYDQAAAVFVGVTLALDKDSISSLIWHYAAPFGFINSTHLVGWEQRKLTTETNRPYFCGKVDQMVIKMENGKYPDSRDGFANHAFLSYSGRALDATCGPQYGQFTLEDYFSKSIDYEVGTYSENQSWNTHIKNWPTDKANVAREEGGVKIDNAAFDTPKPKGIIQFGSLTAARYDPYSSEHHPAAIKEFFKSIPSKVASGKQFGIQVSQVNELERALLRKMGVDESHGADRSMRMTGDVAHISWSFKVPSSGRLDIDIAIYDGPDQATRAFEAILLATARSTTETCEVRRADWQGARHALGKAPGHGRHILEAENFVISLDGLQSNAELAQYVEIIQQYLTEPVPGSHPAPVGKFTVTVDGTELLPDESLSCKIGDQISVQVTAENAFALAVDSYENGNLFCLRTKKPADRHDLVIFHFLARHAGPEKVWFVARDAAWLNPQPSKPYSFEIE